VPVFAGIDYSLTCPAICIYNTKDGPFSFSNTKAFFRSNLARFEMFSEGNLIGENHNPWKSDIERYDDISSWALDCLKKHKVKKVFLEGYSFGSTGKVFNIAENTAILKYNLWDEYIDIEIVAPKQIKKFASGSGNASKERMYEAFIKENGDLNLMATLTPRSTNVISPVNDIVDAYYILKYGINNDGF
jgi:hypothetical protein